ncbi:MAG: tetratricopeptide repeat protein, partial [Acidobacteria bacterium]|nr:tetratricopeptide repeat protein [Acidobacteriota bacterium]
RASAAESVTLGQIVGTLDYMSPEQSRGETVDQRTDIYAFGLILTDLLLGRRKRADGVTPWDAMTARITKAPEPLTKRDAKIPEAFAAVITKCVQLSPADRFETTHALVAALSRLDDQGELIPEPVTKRITPLMATGIAAAMVALLGGTWWVAKGNGPVEHKPVSVLIADFVNTTNNPVFSSVVEQALSVGIEGASFISSFPHRDAMRVVTEIKAGPTLDDNAARLVAMREGLNVTIGGSIAAKGSGYVISVKATSVGDQKVLLDWNTTAANQDDVLPAVGRAAERVRRTLGDNNTANASSEQETFTATSLEAAKTYAEAQDLNWAGKFDEAIAGYLKTIQIDPSFGRAHAGLAALYTNRGRTADADASYQTALGLVDRMTEREKLRTRGGYYLFKKNYDNAIEEFSALLKKYPADTSGMANMAVAQFYKRDMKTAVDMGRRASEAYPNNVIRKSNAALFALYAGDFDTARQLATETLALNPAFPKAFFTLGMSQLAQRQPADAITTFNKLGLIATAAAQGSAMSGLIDIALYEGREQDALGLLGDAIAADRVAKDKSSLGRRLAIRASVLISRGDKAGALRDAREAVTLGSEEGILYRAGHAFIDAGQPAVAVELAADLDNRLENEPRLYGALLRGEAALAAGRARSALNAFQDAQKLGDSWMGRLSLGRAYLALNAFTEAAAEFDRCLSRRGEATAVFLDDQPSYRVFPPVYYYLGRAQEGMKSASATDSYKTFLAIKEKGDERGLVADARRRVTTPK